MDIYPPKHTVVSHIYYITQPYLLKSGFRPRASIRTRASIRPRASIIPRASLSRIISCVLALSR